MKQIKVTSSVMKAGNSDVSAAIKNKSERIVTNIATVLEYGTGNELASFECLSTAKIIDFSKSTTARKVNAGDFPLPVYLSKQMKRWRIRDIKFWLLDPTTYRQRNMLKELEND